MRFNLAAVILAASSSLLASAYAGEAISESSPTSLLRGSAPLNDRLVEDDAADFQLYMFSQSWLPRFCQGTDYPGCSNPLPQWNEVATIHGLWPEYDDNTGSSSNTGPMNCADNFDSSSVNNADLVNIWPNVKSDADPLSVDYQSFWRDEWNKHGSCSGLAQQDYFSQIIALYNSFPTPAVVTQNVGGSVPLSTLVNAYGGKGYVALRCTGKQLAEIRTCWEKRSDNSVGNQVMCPAFAKSSCTGSSITIPSF